MNWDAIGAVGEILGAIAVVFSLIYLASQIRVSNKAARQEAMHEAMEGFSQLVGQLTTEPTLARIWVKGSANDKDLTIYDMVQYRSFLTQLNNYWERTYRLEKSGDLDSWVWENITGPRLQIMSSEGYKAWFRDRKSTLNDEWRQFLESDMEKTTGEYTPLGINKEMSSQLGK